MESKKHNNQIACKRSHIPKIAIFVLVLVFMINTLFALSPGKNMVTFTISAGMKSFLSFELGYEYTITDFLAPQIAVSFGVLSHNISIEVNMNIYVWYLHISTPVNFGFSKPSDEWLPYINWTPGMGVLIADPNANSGAALVFVDMGWTFPLIFDLRSFMSKPGLSFQWGGVYIL